MLGTLNENHREVTVIGAGFAGLLAAYRLLQRGWQVKLYDAAPRAGGLIQTVQTEYGIAEAAAHTIRSSPAMDALFQELGVETVSAQTKKKFIWRSGRMRAFPLSIAEAIELGLRAAFMPAKSHYENLEEWILHHAGQGALDNIFYAMMNGIYAARATELSPQLVFSKLVPPQGKTLLAHALSLPKNKYKPQVIAPRAGMMALTDALFAAIEKSPNAQVLLGENVSTLPDAPNVIVATPAPAAAKLLNDFPQSAAALQNVKYAPMIAATVFLDKKSHTPPDGIGVLCAAHQPLRALGVLFNSATFAARVRDAENVASYTVMFGGTGDAAVMNLSDAEISAIIQTELQTILNLSAPPLETVIHRWSAAIPVYSPELAHTHEILKQDFCAAPGRVLFGNYTGQISLRGMAEFAMTSA